jgi:hypothetical protein
MGRKEIITLFICLLGYGLNAQQPDDSTFVKKGLLRTFGCFAFDYRTHQSVWDYRLHGYLEYFSEKKISVVGEYQYYLDSGTDFPVISKNFSLGCGIAYHWPKKRIDPYVFMMSIGNFYQAQVMVDSTIVKDEINTEASPGMAIGGGITFYVWKHIHFFLQFRYHRTVIYSPIIIEDMDSFSVSYGVGLNLFTGKKNKVAKD